MLAFRGRSGYSRCWVLPVMRANSLQSASSHILAKVVERLGRWPSFANSHINASYFSRLHEANLHSILHDVTDLVTFMCAVVASTIIGVSVIVTRRPQSGIIRNDDVIISVVDNNSPVEATGLCQCRAVKILRIVHCSLHDAAHHHLAWMTSLDGSTQQRLTTFVVCLRNYAYVGVCDIYMEGQGDIQTAGQRGRERDRCPSRDPPLMTSLRWQLCHSPW